MRRPASLAPFALAAAVATAAAVGVIAGVSGGGAIMPGALHGLDDEGDHEVHGGVRAHAEIDDCGACHPGPFAGETASEKCVACHDDIAAELRDPATRHGRVKARGRCLQCHTEHRGADGELTRVDFAHFDHEATGFSLVAHRKTKAGATFRCADCHGGDVDRFEPGRCEACHRTDDAAFVTRHEAAWGAACRACHDGVDRFDRRRFDHARTPFALAGKHAAVACERCHTAVRALAGYRAARTACEACHAKDDVHAGRLGAACARCHTAGGWKTIVPGSFDHGKTRFPLTGAHGKVACADCHWQGRLAGTPRDCAQCHPRPARHFPGACDTCHTTATWRGARRPARPAPAPRPAPARTPPPPDEDAGPGPGDATTTASPRHR